MTAFLLRGGRQCKMFWTSKCIISGLECRRMFKLVSAHTMDPSSPFWGAHPTKKYVHAKAHPLEKFRRKNVFFLRSSWSESPVGCQMSKLLKTFQLRPNYLRNRFIALPCPSNRFYDHKRKTSEMHFQGLFSLRI